MNVKDFIYHLVKERRHLRSYYEHSEFRPEIAILSSLMEFPCKIQDGKCAGKKRTPKCCCVNCATCIGHFEKVWPNDLDTLREYAKRFTIENGFWRPEQGCVLPRHMRSLTCAFYICESIHPEFDKRNDKDLRDLRYAVGMYTQSPHLYGTDRNGQYGKEIRETETKLEKAVDKVMQKRKLYYDPFNQRLVKILKKETNRNWTVLHFEDKNMSPISISHNLNKGGIV